MVDDDNLRVSLDRDTLATLMAALAYAIAALEKLPRESVAVAVEIPPLKMTLQRWVPDEESRASLVKNAREILDSTSEEFESSKAV